MRSPSYWLSVMLLLAACTPEKKTLQVIIEGGDGGLLPRAPPSEVHLDVHALQAVSEDGVAKGLRALMVLRNGYLTYDVYGHGVDARSERDLGDSSQALVALASGIAVREDRFSLPLHSGFDPAQLRDAIQAASHQTYAQYFSQHVWRPVNAAPAWIGVAPGAPVPVDCCFHARLLDWMRIADLLVQDGYFQGQQLVPKGWVAQMRQPVAADGLRGFGVWLPSAAHGAESFAADHVFFLRGPGHWRLWLVPDLKLAVLFGADADAAESPAWDETRVLNLVLRAVSDPVNSTDPAAKLKGLVPGH